MSDWFRKQSWTKDDEANFFRHWAKSRTEFNKAQYLKIQAFTLYDTHKKKFFDVILSLLDKYFNDFPNEQFFKCSCLHLYGRIYYFRKIYDKAFDYYQKAAYQELEYPKVISGAWIDYAQMVIRLNRVDLYDEAEKIINTHYNSLIFPIEIYKSNAVLAIIYNSRGDRETACRYKKIANEAASIKTPILKNCDEIGLVDKKDNFLENAMKNIK